MVIRFTSKIILIASVTAAMVAPAGAFGLTKLPVAGVSASSNTIEIAAPKVVPVARGVKKYFQPHVYTGGRFTRRMAAKVGLPNAVILDRRHEFGDVYQCSFITHRGKKAIACD